MQVAVHLVGSPPANEAKAIRVDAATQQGHGAASASGASGNIAGTEIRQVWGEKGDGTAEQRGDIGGKCELPRLLRSHAESINGRGRESAVGAEVAEAPN